MHQFKKSVFALALTVTTGFSALAQSADDIVNKYLTAIGGADNWRKVTALKYTGSISAQGMEMPVTMTIQKDKAMRMEFTVMGTNNYQIVTEKEGWAYMPVAQMQKPEPMTADQVKEAKDNLDFQELLDYKTKGAKIEYVGKDDFEGTEVHKIAYTSKEGKKKTMFFDASTYYLLKETEKAMVDGKEVEGTAKFSDYQKHTSGLVFAMAMESDNGPIKFSAIEVNPKIDPAIFKPESK